LEVGAILITLELRLKSSARLNRISTQGVARRCTIFYPNQQLGVSIARWFVLVR
jgi:hypothetical protein